MFDILNQSGLDLGPLEGLVQEFMPFAQERHGFKNPPKLFLLGDEENAANPLGKTGGYNPDSMEVTIYVSGRHPKDILRSLSHELVHHNQNERGDLSDVLSTALGYAQDDPHMRDMEREAYEQGNLCFRDWEDGRKKQLQESIYYETVIGGEDMSKKVPLKEWKDNEVHYRLMKKFGLIKEEDKVDDAGAEQLYHEETTDEKRPGDGEEEEDDEEEDSSESINESLNKLSNEATQLLNERSMNDVFYPSTDPGTPAPAELAWEWPGIFADRHANQFPESTGQRGTGVTTTNRRWTGAGWGKPYAEDHMQTGFRHPRMTNSIFDWSDPRPVTTYIDKAPGSGDPAGVVTGPSRPLSLKRPFGDVGWDVRGGQVRDPVAEDWDADNPGRDTAVAVAEAAALAAGLRMPMSYNLGALGTRTVQRPGFTMQASDPLSRLGLRHGQTPARRGWTPGQIEAWRRAEAGLVDRTTRTGRIYGQQRPGWYEEFYPARGRAGQTSSRFDKDPFRSGGRNWSAADTGAAQSAAAEAEQRAAWNSLSDEEKMRMAADDAWGADSGRWARRAQKLDDSPAGPTLTPEELAAERGFFETPGQSVGRKLKRGLGLGTAATLGGYPLVRSDEFAYPWPTRRHGRPEAMAPRVGEGEWYNPMSWDYQGEPWAFRRDESGNPLPLIGDQSWLDEYFPGPVPSDNRGTWSDHVQSMRDRKTRQAFPEIEGLDFLQIKEMYENNKLTPEQEARYEALIRAVRLPADDDVDPGGSFQMSPGPRDPDEQLRVDRAVQGRPKRGASATTLPTLPAWTRAFGAPKRDDEEKVPNLEEKVPYTWDDLNESNDEWYNNSLYESLKKNWVK